MSTHDTEICGFLDVKLTRRRYVVQRVRKRAITLSKMWKRSWCSVRNLGFGLGLQVQFDQKLSCYGDTLKQNEKDNSVMISPSVIVHRIHSRTNNLRLVYCWQWTGSLCYHCPSTRRLRYSVGSANIRHLLKPKGIIAPRDRTLYL